MQSLWCLDVPSPSTLIENGDDVGWCGAGWKGECIIVPYADTKYLQKICDWFHILYCFTILPPFLFKRGSSAVYFEPALHAQHRMLCTTILWHAIRPRGGVAYVRGI